MARVTARRFVFAFALVLLGVGVGLYLGVAVPAGAQAPGNGGEEWGPGGFSPGFEGFIPPPMEITQGMPIVTEQYVYVLMGRTLYQFRHDRFPDGVKRFTFKPEAPPPPQPFMPGLPSKGG